MIRRWGIPLATLALVSGSILTAVAGGANAAPFTHNHGITIITHNHDTTSIRPGGNVKGFQPGGLIKPLAGTHITRDGKLYTEESTNWSGYAASGGSGAFNSVSAHWVQPTATCNFFGPQYAAFWVGLDGFNSSSVEQTGTDSDCSSKTPNYYGWYEMYPAAPVYYTNPVKPGDVMYARVTHNSSAGTYTLVLIDYTEGWNQTQVIQESGLANSSAEVITEAPSTSAGPLPLANFGIVLYGGTTVNGGLMVSQNPTQINMIGRSGDLLDTTSSMDGYSDFNDVWDAAF